MYVVVRPCLSYYKPVSDTCGEVIEANGSFTIYTDKSKGRTWIVNQGIGIKSCKDKDLGVGTLSDSSSILILR